MKIVSFVFFFQSIVELEEEMLNGQKLQGPQTSAEVYKILQKRDMVNKWAVLYTPACHGIWKCGNTSFLLYFLGFRCSPPSTRSASRARRWESSLPAYRTTPNTWTAATRWQHHPMRHQRTNPKQKNTQPLHGNDQFLVTSHIRNYIFVFLLIFHAM